MLRPVSAKNNTPPSVNQVNKASKIAELSIEGAQYLLERVQALYPKAKEILNFCQKVEEMTFARLGRDGIDSWAGESTPSSVLNFHRHIAMKAAEKFTMPQRLQFDFAVNTDGQLVRAYTTDDGSLLSPEEIEDLDRFLNAWLMENGASSDKGYFYQTNASGEKIPLEREQVKTLMNDDSFTEYVKKHSKIDLRQNYHEVVSPQTKERIQQSLSELNETLAQVERARAAL